MVDTSAAAPPAAMKKKSSGLKAPGGHPVRQMREPIESMAR
jgi:hypothetical protein